MYADDYLAAATWLAKRGIALDGHLVADDAVQISSGRPNRCKLWYRLPDGVPWLPTLNLRESRPFSNVVAAAQMSDVFNLIDREKFLAGEEFDSGQIIAPGAEATPVGLSFDGRVGRYHVRFIFFLDKDGAPHFASIWSPGRPKRLKPSLVKKFRRERQHLAKTVAQEFGVALQIVDRMDGAPKITELIYDGTVETLEPAIPLPTTH